MTEQRYDAGFEMYAELKDIQRIKGSMIIMNVFEIMMMHHKSDGAFS